MLNNFIHSREGLSSHVQEVKKYHDAPKSQRYICWTRKQMRYMLGDKKPSLVVGVGTHPPTRPAERSSSCPSHHNETCNALVGLYNPNPNPQTLRGALVMVRARLDAFDNAGVVFFALSSLIVRCVPTSLALASQC